MVIYDLICDAHHAFEGWFKDADDFAHQQAQNMVLCPVCDSAAVSKKLTAPNISKAGVSQAHGQQTRHQIATGDGSADAFVKLQDMLGRVHDFIERNFEDVGNRFAEEALSIHRGDREEANIRGTASAEEMEQLADEGVAAMRLPPKPINKKKLN